MRLYDDLLKVKNTTTTLTVHASNVTGNIIFYSSEKKPDDGGKVYTHMVLSRREAKELVAVLTNELIDNPNRGQE